MSAAARKRAANQLVRRLSATEFAKRLSDVLNRVRYQRETVVIERWGKPVCQLTPVSGSPAFQLSDLVALLHSLSAAGEEWATAVSQGEAEPSEFEGFEWPH